MKIWINMFIVPEFLLLKNKRHTGKKMRGKYVCFYDLLISMGFSLSLKTIHSIASSIQYIQNRIISPIAELGPCLGQHQEQPSSRHARSVSEEESRPLKATLFM